jgi:N-methylhydantoinase A
MLGVPAVDVRSVGAGGGSIAWLDAGGLLRVGPQSAGADPGPACYGAGGVDPTVTDAALVLGYLDPDFFLGGRMPLDVDAARRALAGVAEPLGLPPEAAAFSVLAVANETMIHAIKEITVSEGVDPGETVLVAGGGAAGINILTISRELGCRAVVIPRTASVLSACGMQFSDIQIEQSASAPTRSWSFDRKAVNAALGVIDTRLEEFAKPLSARGFSDRWTAYRVSAHYAAQVWELDVELAVHRFESEADCEAIARAFHECHERVFAVADPASEIEFLNWTGRITLRLPRVAQVPAAGAGGAASGAERFRRAWFSLDEVHSARVVRGADLISGASVEGPALIEEETTTLVIPPGLVARLSPHESYIVELEGGEEAG